jgi:polysaccharide transporter, PST family
VAAAYVVATYLLFVPGIAYAGRPLGIGAADAWATVGPQVITALGTAGIAFLVGHTVLLHTAPLPRLVILGVSCCAVYLATMTLGFRMTKPLVVAASLVRTRVSS